MNRAAGAGAAVGLTGLVAPIVLIVALLGGLTAVATETASSGVDATKIPPLARELLPDITAITTSTCPELPPLWVVAEVTAESSWDPTAYSSDRNGGAAGLYQLNEANWVAAGGTPWETSPPPADADVLDAQRHLEVAIPFVCANLRAAAAHLQTTGKPTSALDGMLVCHIAGCSRVTDSATGIPTAGEAGCDRTCAVLIANYVDKVHSLVAHYSVTAGPVAVDDLPAPTPFAGDGVQCTADDPTGGRCLTPVTRHAHDEIIRVFGSPGPTSPIRSAGCWGEHAWNPDSDHPRGQACDYFPDAAGRFPEGQELQNGWRDCLIFGVTGPTRRAQLGGRTSHDRDDRGCAGSD